MDDWKINLKPFLGGIGDMPRDLRKGREIFDGYVRGCGLKYGNIRELCNLDPLFQYAFEKATSPSPNGKPRTIVTPLNLMNIFTILRMNLSNSPFNGHIVEFGSLRGGSAIFMAIVAKELIPDAKVFSFDSFRGFPSTNPEVDAYREGSFEEVDVKELENYTLNLGLSNLNFIEGPFEETVPETLAKLEKISLVHIDCDIYDAVAFAYENAKPFLTKDAYLIFDDPLVPTCIGAFEAVEEYLIRRDKLHAEQIFPHLVFRSPKINSDDIKK
ncbi:MAG: TylF/MycF/NovP-related O-methyltransferase [Rhodospirillales bacterium]